MNIFKIENIIKKEKKETKETKDKKEKINKKDNKIKTSIKKEKKTKKEEDNKILNNKRKRQKTKKEKEKSNNNTIEKAYTSTNPENINFFYELTYDSESYYAFGNTFCVFKSIDDIFYLVYSNKNSILSYNIIDNTKINEIKNANDKNKFITNFRHYFDKTNNRDLLISISAWDNSIKLWDVSTWECLNDIKNINYSGYLYSATFLYDNNNIYIITINHAKNYYYNNNFFFYNKYNYNQLGVSEGIKIFDLNGNKINYICDSYDNAYYIDTYYDNNLKKLYIITGNIDSVKSYDYHENKVYHIYQNTIKKKKK